MSLTLAAPTTAATRPLALRMRGDLAALPLVIRGRRQWNVKDPVALTYFRLRDEEYAVLEMLDGQATPDEIVARFNQRFAPRRLTAEGLHAFVARAHRDGLVISDAPGQTQTLLERAAKRRQRRWLATLMSPLSIRFPGIDPTPVLARLDPLARWLSSPVGLALGALTIAAALLLVFAQFGQLMMRMPDFRDFFTARNALLIVAALSLTKVLHELGHALTCRRLGGECHELGVMLLVFAPCLYCNVSDSWMFASRARRIAVAAAGMYVEALLAAVATFLWWFTEPGLMNSLALDVMFVCSVSTLLFNGNPLLRYDGYYILSDLVEIPNLAEQSSTAMRRFLGRICLGLKTRAPHDDAHTSQLFLLAYSLASTLYRWMITVFLLWFCYRVLEPYHLEALAKALAVGVVAGMIFGPMSSAVRFVRTPTVRSNVHRGRFFATLLVLVGILAALAFVPLPVHVLAPVLVEPLDAQRVYVSQAGRLDSNVHAGDVVQAGQVLAVLTDPEIDLEIVRLTGKRDEQQQHVQNLERRRNQDPQASAQIPAAAEALTDLDERLRKKLADRDRLELRAPVAGTVLPPEWRSEPNSGERLPNWNGTPLVDQNLGSMLETGTLYCLIGDPRHIELVAMVDQADVERLAVGDRALVKLDQAAGETLWANVVEIAAMDLTVAPRQLVYGGELAARKDAAGVARPLSATYQVKLALDDHAQRLLLGARGRARIYAAPESVLGRVRRWLRGTFHFPVS